MIVVCQHCSTRLQIDDDKITPRAIAKCPKCGKDMNLGPASPASEKSALAVGGSPATEGKRFEHADPAPLFELEDQKPVTAPSLSDDEKLLQMLARLVSQNSESSSGPSIDKPGWKQRKALVCAPEEYREKVARPLAQEGYQVFVALDTKQAVERMRENQLDVVLLDPQFDAPDQGAAFVVREVNVLRPAQRRRLFFVLLSPSLRTMDAHGAFLNNVNAIINMKEIDDLVKILDHSIREYNELYKDFNAALRVPAL